MNSEEERLRSLLAATLTAEPPPQRLDLAAARRSGRRRLRLRRAFLGGGGAVAVSAVTAVALVVGSFAPPGAARPAAAPGHGTKPGTLRAPRQFNPLVPYAAFGTLPNGFSVQGQSDITGSTGMDVQAAEQTAAGGALLNLGVYAPGWCAIGGRRLLPAAGPRRAAGCALGLVQGRAPRVNGHPAYWVRRGLIWEYAPGAWSALLVFPYSSPHGAPSPSASASPTPFSSASPNPSPSASASPTPFSSASPNPSPSASPGAASALGAASAAPSPSPSSSASPTPFSSASPTPFSSASPDPSSSASPTRGQGSPTAPVSSLSRPAAPTRQELLATAAHVRFGAATPIRFPFRLTALPAGWQARDVSYRVADGLLEAESLTIGPAGDPSQDVSVSTTTVGAGAHGCGQFIHGRLRHVTVRGARAVLRIIDSPPRLDEDLCIEDLHGVSFDLAESTLRPLSPLAVGLRSLGPDPRRWTASPLP